MSGAFNARRPRRRPSINIAPLIDVMFLLLIFFMVSSTFRDQLGIGVDLPSAETATKQDITQHKINVNKNGAIFFDGEEIDTSQVRDKLQAILDEDPETPIALEADNEAPFGPIVLVIDTARKLGAKKIIVPTSLPDEVLSTETLP